MGKVMHAAPEYCYVPVNYLGGIETIPIEVSIMDGRAVELDWRVNGFELIQHTSAVTDWDNEAEVAKCYYKEMSTLAKALSGADYALLGGHISRNPEAAAVHEDYAPIQFVHSDFTDNYGRLVTERYLSGDPELAKNLEAAGLAAEDVARAKRMLILQFWRNTGPALVDLPIAFCDAQSVPRSDMQSIHVPNYAGGDFAFDTFGVNPPPSSDSHAWYVFPQMQVHEVVAFRTFDSEMAAKGERYWTPHSAFLDPHAGPDAPPRRSIEVRATCLFY